MTPELPRAPMSDPWLMALQTASMSASPSAQPGHHRLERERHVGAGVAVRDRVDVEAVESFLVRLQRIAVGHDDGSEVGGVEALPRCHERRA